MANETKAAPKADPKAANQKLPTNAPAAPAAPAAKAKKAKGPDLSKLSPEKKAAFEKAMADYEAKRKALAETKRKAEEEAGITVAKKTRTAGPKFEGLNPYLMVGVVVGGSGLTSDADKAIVAKIGNGMTLKDLLGIDGVDYSWFRRRFVRNSLRVNGKTMAELLNGIATPDQVKANQPAPAQAPAAA